VRSIWLLGVGAVALVASGCTKVYTEQSLEEKEAKQLQDLPKDEKEEEATTRRVEEDGGLNAEAMEREGELENEEVTNTP